ncbi:MAG: hypothetical protein LBL02_02985 [Endomicrobium sp.]|jgi:hypothetical protein|nr:hypothetical protein [Endomicrobium sp.]
MVVSFESLEVLCELERSERYFITNDKDQGAIGILVKEAKSFLKYLLRKSVTEK